MVGSEHQIFTIHYLDGQGDKVDIESDDDLQCAYEWAHEKANSNIKLIITSQVIDGIDGVNIDDLYASATWGYLSEHVTLPDEVEQSF